jgi:hypothetical protein
MRNTVTVHFLANAGMGYGLDQWDINQWDLQLPGVSVEQDP